MILALISAFLFAYLLGSIPFGLLLTRAAGVGDIRSMGSGNIGATNVLRTGGKKLAALTLLLDAGKGAAAVLISGSFMPPLGQIAAMGAVLGHMFPVWLKFKGGKGVAPGIGVITALNWPTGALVFALWLPIVAITRISSLSTLIVAGFVPVFLAISLTAADCCSTEFTIVCEIIFTSSMVFK